MKHLHTLVLASFLVLALVLTGCNNISCASNSDCPRATACDGIAGPGQSLRGTCKPICRSVADCQSGQRCNGINVRGGTSVCK